MTRCSAKGTRFGLGCRQFPVSFNDELLFRLFDSFWLESLRFIVRAVGEDKSAVSTAGVELRAIFGRFFWALQEG